MKKNWILFFIICGVAYIWLFYTQAQRQAEYKKNVEAWQEQKDAWDAEQERLAQLREETRKALVGQRSTTDTASSDDSTTGALPSDRPIPSMKELAESDRELLRQILTVADARQLPPIDTPLYRVVFTELGARPIIWDVKDSEYITNVAENGEELDEDAAVNLIPYPGDNTTRAYPLEFVGDTVRDFNSEIIPGEVTKLNGATIVSFTSDPINGLVVKKDFLFRDDSYVVDCTIEFINGPETDKRLGRGDQGFGIGWQGGFGQPHLNDRVHGQDTVVIAYDGGVRVKRLGRDSEPDIFASNIDWAGQEKKFFAALIIPDPSNPLAVNAVRSRFEARNDAIEYQQRGSNVPVSVELMHPEYRLATGESLKLKYQIYVGPRSREALMSKDFMEMAGRTEPSAIVFHQIPLGLRFLRPICLMLLGLMRWLHDFIGVWGLAIIVTTIIVRIIIYPLTHWAIKNQARTMIEQQRIRPEMEAITKKYKNDPMKRNQAVMQLYRDHNISPFGMFRGCLPILLQTPVFLALYVVFEQSVELRGQSFLWIPDLSGPDRLIDWNTPIILIGSSFNVLPILMGITNWVQMRIMRMPATDEMQERIQKQMATMMPIFFVFILYKLPSGLILYWIVSNCISILQSFMTKRIIARHMAEHEAAKKNAAPGAADAKKLSGRAVTES